MGHRLPPPHHAARAELTGRGSRRLDAALWHKRNQGDDAVSNGPWYVAKQLPLPANLSAGGFGQCVSVSGDLVVAGGRGGAVRYVKDSDDDWILDRNWLTGEAQDTSVDGDVTAIATPAETIVATHNETDLLLRGSVSVSVSGRSVAIATESGDVYVDDRVAAHDAVALALDGDLLLIGSIGSAYLLSRRDDWGRIATLVGEQQNSDYGRAVALNAGFAVVAGSDAAYLFAGEADWSRVARFKLDAISVAVTTGFVAIGSSGQTYVYEETESDWQLTARIDKSAPGSLFGYAVAADSDTIVVGAPGHDTVYIFAQKSGSRSVDPSHNVIGVVIAYVVFPTLILFILCALIRAFEACGEHLRAQQPRAQPPLALTRTFPLDNDAVPTARVINVELVSTSRDRAIPAATLVQHAAPVS